MADWKIEDDVPIASNVERRGRTLKYPWDQMKIGQSLFIQGLPEGRRALASACNYGRRNYATEFRKSTFYPEGGWEITGRKKFVGRQVEEGWRIWRDADEQIPETEITTIEENGVKIRFIKENQ